MTNAEDDAMRFVTGRKKDTTEEGNAPVEWFKNSFICKDWYFSSIFEKIIIVLSFLTLLWTLFKLVFLQKL